MYRVGLFIGFSFLIASVLPESALAQSFRCLDGSQSHTATAQEAASAQNGSIIAGVSQVCPGDAQSGIDPQVGQAKIDLSSLRCSTKVKIEDLSDKFAICADKFMQQLRQSSPRACIRSAYRSKEEQAAACMSICGRLSCPGRCAPPGHSYHQYGLAIDVDGVANNVQSWQIAAQNGLVNPVGLHHSDPNHYQSGNADCASMPVPAGDQGDYYNDTQHFFQAPSLPFQNILDSLIPGRQQSPPPPQLPPSDQISPLPVSSSTRISSLLDSNTTPLLNASSTISLPLLDDSFSPLQPTPVSDQLTAPPLETTGSAYDLLNAIADNSETSINATGSVLTLNENLYNQIDVVRYDQNSDSPPPTIPENMVPIGPQGSQTFISQDMQYQNTSWTPPSNTTFMQKILANLQQALYQILAWARPFGTLAPPMDVAGT